MIFDEMLVFHILMQRMSVISSTLHLITRDRYAFKLDALCVQI